MIRIGIIGCGRILAAHLRGYRLLKEAGYGDFKITALCSRKAEDAWGYVQRNGSYTQRPAVSRIPNDPLGIGNEFLSDFQETDSVQVYTDYRELITVGCVDAVNDFTVHGLHHLVGMAALKNGKHLLTQKPLAVTIKAAARLVEAAAEAGVTFGVFENARQRLATRQWQWLLRSGLMGKPQMALMGNVGTWWAPAQIVAETPWRHCLCEGGGISLDLGVHQFDIIRSVMGEVDSVTARTDIVEPIRSTFDETGKVLLDRIKCDADDTFYASFAGRNSSGSGTLFGSWAGGGAPTVLGNGPTFYGSKGRVSGDELHLSGEMGPESLSEKYFSSASPSTRERNQPFGLTNEFAIAQYDWLKAIQEGRQPEVDGNEGLIDLACAYAIVESAHSGRTVKVAEVLDGSVSAYQDAINQHYNI
ncbi:MAG TPA: Gfo/Idh/MocA family oxidoreductase [Verrucomicrobiales bacterium]|nr:Gfo/Idh/MocA family oxidoreductase [Verrucomicrobiales bacterium]HIL72082.1 Gfo/Idh/MocA family oxidoreductase [Verrucomicrobiota bacterium]